MSRCYICDVSPGNPSIYRISKSRPSLSFDSKRLAWVCSECAEPDTSINLADLILSDEDFLEPKEPPKEPDNGNTGR